MSSSLDSWFSVFRFPSSVRLDPGIKFLNLEQMTSGDSSPLEVKQAGLELQNASSTSTLPFDSKRATSGTSSPSKVEQARLEL